MHFPLSKAVDPYTARRINEPLSFFGDRENIAKPVANPREDFPENFFPLSPKSLLYINLRETSLHTSLGVLTSQRLTGADLSILCNGLLFDF